MKQIFTHTLVALMILPATWSCTRDKGVLPSGNSGLKPLQIDIETRALEPGIDLRIIMTDAFTGDIAVNDYPAKAHSASGNYYVDVTDGFWNIYILANEPVRLTSALDDARTQADILPLTVNFSEIPLKENPGEGTPTETNIPVIYYATARVRQSDSDPEKGELSIQDGSTWGPWSHIAQANVQRLASKVSLNMNKRTPQGSDRVTITNVELSNIPDFGYLLQKPYTSGVTHTVTPADFTSGKTFSQNSDTFEPIFSDLIIPEYRMQQISNKDKAVSIKIEAEYNGTSTVYYVPVRRTADEEDYELLRNNHYVINATLNTKGDLGYLPEVKYQVADWTEAGGGTSGSIGENAITFSGSWKNNPLVSGNTVTVLGAQNHTAEYSFTLTHPQNATWTAALSNNTDFELISDPGNNVVSSGKTRPGSPYTIRIKPRNSVTSPISTHFNITVNYENGKTVELNLTEATEGTTNQYIITAK